MILQSPGQGLAYRWRAFLWRTVGRHAFCFTPNPAFGIRRAILRMFGANLNPLAKIRRSVRIECPWNIRVGAKTAIGDHVALRGDQPISIGDRSTVSQLAIVSTVMSVPESRLAPITIEDDAWVATDVLVLPGSIIRTGVVVGARSVVDGELPAWSVAAGDPARPRGRRQWRSDGGDVGAGSLEPPQGDR